jgi:glucokinase
MRSLGIDIGGRSIKLAVRDGDRWHTAQSDSYDRPDTATLVDALHRALPADLKTVDTVGLCLPGIYDTALGRVTHSVNVPGLVGTPVIHLLHDALGFAPPAPAIYSDAVAAAYDLYRSRNLTGRLLVIAIGTGVGAAVLDDGVPLRVDGDSPGHLGQLDVTLPGHEDVIGPDGGAGGLEGYLAAPALAHRYGPNPAAALARLTADEPPLLALARAIRIVHAIYRPHHVLLAGGIGIRLTPLVPALRANVEHHLTSIARPGWTLAAGDDDFHAARGAALLADHR